MAETIENQRFIYEFGRFILDPQDKTLFEDGKPVRLPAKEFETLLLLVENNGRALRKEEMLDTIWQDTFVEESNLAKYISHLRKVLGSKGEDYIQTLPKHGYRFSADISQVARSTDETILEKRTIKKVTFRVNEEFDESEALPMLPTAAKRSGMLIYGAMIVVLIALAAGAFYWTRTSSTARINSIAVLPLKPLGDEEGSKVLGLGLTDALITKLGSLRSVAVRRTSDVTRFADADPVDAGRQLNADAVFEGTIQQSDGHIRINARLLKVVSGEQLWAEKFDQPASEIFGLQDALSNKIAGMLAFELKRPQIDQLAARPTENVDAYDKYLRGRFYANQRTEASLTRSIGFYEQAIALDPKFAAAYAGIADAYVTLFNYGFRRADEAIPMVSENLDRAVRLDPGLSDAWLTAAQQAFLYEHDGSKAEQNYQKALELDPGNARAFLRYGHFLTFWGRFDDALKNLDRARELDPLSPIAQTDTGLVYLFRRDFRTAIKVLQKTVVEYPELPLAHSFLAQSYLGIGEIDLAMDENLAYLTASGNGEMASRIEAVRRSKNLQAAYQEWFDETLKQQDPGDAPALQLAYISAVLKDRDKTLQWLGKAELDHEPVIGQLRYFFVYDLSATMNAFRRSWRK